MAFDTLRPDADSIDGNWKNEVGNQTNLFASIDESVASDTDYIGSGTVPNVDIAKIRLSNPVGGVDEPATVRYRYKKNDASDPLLVNLIVSLLQGTTVIAEWRHDDIGTSFTLAEQTLTTDQFDSISDFTDLYLQFTAFPWWLVDANIDLDFDSGRYYDGSNGGSGQVITDYLSASRASVGFANTSTGTLTQFSSNTLRITNLGLLIEDARTNVIYPSVPNTTDWGKDRCTLGSNDAVSPDGTTTATLITDTVFSGTVTFTNSNNGSGTGGVRYTASIYVKAGTHAFCVLNMQELGGFGSAALRVNASTGVIENVGLDAGWTSDTSATETLANGWFRLSISAILTTSASIRVLYSLTATNGGAYNGDGTGTQWVWGAQIEAGSFVSSYIPTTTTSATRAADNITNIGNLSTKIAAATASIVVQTSYAETTDIAASIVDSNGTNLLGFDATDHGVASIGATLATGNTANRSTIADKLGLAWDAGGRSIVLNGGTVVTDATAQTPNATQHMGSVSGTSNFLYAYVQRFTVWTTKLADATLDAFTA